MSSNVNNLFMQALKVGGVTALITFVGGTAWVGSMSANFVGPLPGMSLGTGVAGGAAYAAVEWWESGV